MKHLVILDPDFEPPYTTKAEMAIVFENMPGSTELIDEVHDAFGRTIDDRGYRKPDYWPDVDDDEGGDE